MLIMTQSSFQHPDIHILKITALDLEDFSFVKKTTAIQRG